MSSAKALGKKRKATPTAPPSPDPSSSDDGLSDTEQQQRKVQRGEKNASVGTSQAAALTGITPKSVAHAPITTAAQASSGGAKDRKMHHKYAFTDGLPKWVYLAGVPTSTYCDCTVYPLYLENARTAKDYKELKGADPGTKFSIHSQIAVGPLTFNGGILDGFGSLGDKSKEKGWPGRQHFMVCGQGLLTPEDEKPRSYFNPDTKKLMKLPAFAPMVRETCKNLRAFVFDGFRKLFDNPKVQPEWKERTFRLVKRDLCSKKGAAWKCTGEIADNGDMVNVGDDFVATDASGAVVTNDHPEVQADALARWFRYVRAPLVPETDMKLHWTDERCTASKWIRKVFTRPKKKGRQRRGAGVNQPPPPMTNILGGPFKDHWDFDESEIPEALIQFALDNGGVYNPVTYVDNAGRHIVATEEQPYVLGGGSLISYEMFSRWYSAGDKCGVKFYWSGDIQRNSLRTAQTNSSLLNLDEEGAEEATEEERAAFMAEAGDGDESHYEMSVQS